MKTDEQLVLGYLSGDNLAIEALIKRYSRVILGFSRRMVGVAAEDITQETFLKMWAHLADFKQGESFKSWLFKIAQNTAIDYLRKKKEVPFTKLENEETSVKFADTLFDENLIPQELVLRSEEARHLNLVMANLPISYREVLDLYYFKFLNFREIGEFLKRPLNTVKNQHLRALKLLRNRLSN